MLDKLMPFLLALAIALAGCAQPTDDEMDDGGMDDGDDMDDGGMHDGNYTLTATGLPATTPANRSFTFTLAVEGPAGETDHLGGHFGPNSTAEPSTAALPGACVHSAQTLPGSFTVTCTLPTAGTWYLRGHTRTGAPDAYRHFWTSEHVIVATPAATLDSLKVGTDAAFPPFEDIDPATNEFVGFDVDLMEAVATRAGFTVEWMNLGFDPLIPALQNGQIDAAISAMSITAAREEQVDFSIPYYEANQSVLVRAEDADKYPDLASLEGMDVKFGAQTGTVGAEQVVERFGEASLTRYDQYPLAVAALKRGDVDAVFMDAPAQKEQASQDSAVVVAFEFSVDDQYGIAVKKGNAALLTRINAALASIFADGTYDELREKWGV